MERRKKVKRKRVWPVCPGIVVRGREFTQFDVVGIRKLIREHRNWGRTRLSEEVCRLLDWRQQSGRLKDRGCRVALLRLETLGYMKLPPRKLDRGGRPPRSIFQNELHSGVVTKMPAELTLQVVDSERQARVWNSLVASHHYLGLPTPVGRLVRYLIAGDSSILGAISFTEAAWSINVRDELLRGFGLDQQEIRSQVISNNRFLILPSVQVKNLASRVLGLAVRQICSDWHDRFGTEPQFIETFVDPAKFSGTCYRAANWNFVGRTKGYAKKGASHQRRESPKLLYLYGIKYNAQQYLRLATSHGERRAA